MFELSSHVLSVKEIQQIVISALENKSKESKTNNDGRQICSLLLGKKKLCSISRISKLKKQMKIFKKLESYVDFEDVYKVIKTKISEKFYAYKRVQQLKKKQFNANQQLIFQKQFAQMSRENYSEQINQLNARINNQFKDQHKKHLLLEVKNIDKIISGYGSNKSQQQQWKFEMSPSNKNSFQMGYIKKVEEERFFKDYYNVVPIDYRKCKNNEKEKDVRIYFTESDRMELEIFYRQALALLSLAIESQRKTSKGNVTRLTDSKVVNNFVTKKNKLFSEKQYSSSIHEKSCSVEIDSQSKVTQRTKLIKNEKLRRAFSASVFKKTQNKTITFDCKFGDENETSNNLSQENAEKSKTISHRRLAKSNTSINDCTIRLSPKKKSNKIKKMNLVQFFQNKMSKILNNIEKEEISNKFKDITYKKVLTFIEKEFCTKKNSDQINDIIMEAQSQIIDLRWRNISRSTKRIL